MIFVDSGFWIAWVDRGDPHYAETEQLLRTFGDDRLLTTNHVVGETWTFLRRRHPHNVASALVSRLSTTDRLKVAFVDEELEEDAWRWLHRHDERRYSFVDATSFAVMRRLAIHFAFTFDADFAAAGFAALRA